MNISSSRAVGMISLVPFGYYWATRLKSARDVAYLVMTSWLPAIWIAWREGSGTATAVVLSFAAGYLAFISFYEVGYLLNDQWDAKRHSHGRPRAIGRAGLAWIGMFILARAMIWIGVGWATGWWWQPAWLVGYAVLTLVIAAHNMVQLRSLRLATFSQLAVLRFTLPLIGLLNVPALAATLAAATLVYCPLRALSYADSKGLLVMPERRSPWFGAAYLSLSLPLLAMLAWLMRTPSLLESGLFVAAAHSVWGALLVRRAARIDREPTHPRRSKN